MESNARGSWLAVGNFGFASVEVFASWKWPRAPPVGMRWSTTTANLPLANAR